MQLFLSEEAFTELPVEYDLFENVMNKVDYYMKCDYPPVDPKEVKGFITHLHNPVNEFPAPLCTEYELSYAQNMKDAAENDLIEAEIDKSADQMK